MRCLRMFVVVVALLLCGCAALTRGGHNAGVVATYPIHGITTPVQRTSEAYERTPPPSPWAWPFVFTAYAAEDLYLTTISAGDLLLTPFYGPFDVEPLDLYRLDEFPPRVNDYQSREVEKQVGEAFVGVVGAVVVVGAVCLVVVYGPCGRYYNGTHCRDGYRHDYCR